MGLPQIIDAGYVLSWSAKWLGKNKVMFNSIHTNEPKAMLEKIHYLLNEADAVVHYNGTKFDIPTLNKEFLTHGMPPPAPYKQIDLLKIARSQFRFPSNKLNYVAQALGLGKKLEHKGHELWIGCMNNDPESWKVMEEYNKQDVLLLEKVYEKLKPWIKGHANYNLYTDAGLVCPNCGSTSHHKRGIYHTGHCSYQRYKCNKCSTWFRGNKSIGKRGEKGIYAA